MGMFDGSLAKHLTLGFIEDANAGLMTELIIDKH